MDNVQKFSAVTQNFERVLKGAGRSLNGVRNKLEGNTWHTKSP